MDITHMCKKFYAQIAAETITTVVESTVHPWSLAVPLAGFLAVVMFEYFPKKLPNNWFFVLYIFF